MGRTLEAVLGSSHRDATSRRTKVREQGCQVGCLPRPEFFLVITQDKQLLENSMKNLAPGGCQILKCSNGFWHPIVWKQNATCWRTRAFLEKLATPKEVFPFWVVSLHYHFYIPSSLASHRRLLGILFMVLLALPRDVLTFPVRPFEYIWISYDMNDMNLLFISVLWRYSVAP